MPRKGAQWKQRELQACRNLTSILAELQCSSRHLSLKAGLHETTIASILRRGIAPNPSTARKVVRCLRHHSQFQHLRQEHIRGFRPLWGQTTPAAAPPATLSVSSMQHTGREDVVLGPSLYWKLLQYKQRNALNTEAAIQQLLRAALQKE